MPETMEATSAPEEGKIAPVAPTNTDEPTCTRQTTGLKRSNATRNSRRSSRTDPAAPPEHTRQTSTLRRSNATRRSDRSARPLSPGSDRPLRRIVTWGETWERPLARTGPSPSASVISAHLFDPLKPGDLEMQTVVTDGDTKIETTVRSAQARRLATKQSCGRTWGGSFCFALAALLLLSAILWGIFFLVMNDQAKRRGAGIFDVAQPRYLQTVGYVNAGLGVLVLVAWAGIKCCCFR